jgi:hypothetical protein
LNKSTFAVNGIRDVHDDMAGYGDSSVRDGMEKMEERKAELTRGEQ